MSAPSSEWVLEQQASALDAFAQTLWWEGAYPEVSERLYAAAMVLRGEITIIGEGDQGVVTRKP